MELKWSTRRQQVSLLDCRPKHQPGQQLSTQAMSKRAQNTHFITHTTDSLRSVMPLPSQCRMYLFFLSFYFVLFGHMFMSWIVTVNRFQSPIAIV